MKPTGDT